MSIKIFSCLLLASILSLNCKKSNEIKSDVTNNVLSVIISADSVKKGNYDLSLLDRTTAFSSIPIVNNLKRQDLLELSGLASSRRNAGLLYKHEDSGNYNEIYVTNAKGDDLGKIVLDGISNRDWEDLACGPGPESSKSYLYVGEIGDNDSAYPSVSVFRFPEPDLSTASPQTVVHIAPDVLKFTYPEGAVNAESLLLDPLTKDLYIMTKQVAHSNLFVAKYPQSTISTTKLAHLASFPFDLLTSADISPDGSEILVRNTGQVWYWKRQPNETVLNAMLRKPMDAPYARNEHQGEAICFAADVSGYFTISETKKFPGDIPALSFYKRN
jgi:hypothetical protein